jgi:signal transduction histidine kinase
MRAEPGRWRARLSTVRVRVTAAATLAVIVVVTLSSGLVVLRHRASLVDQLDESVAIYGDQVAGVLQSSGSWQPPRTEDDDDFVVAVVDDEGAIVTSSIDDDLRPVVARFRARDGIGDVTIDDDSYRATAREVTMPDGRGGTVFVARDREDVDETVAELVGSLLVVIPVAIGLLVVVVWMVVGRTLRTVERMRAEVAAIDLAELDRRVHVPPGGDEIARLATTMNAMLARLESSARRQQQFVADASHELRTPLARMRAELEVDERTPETADVAATRRSQLDEIADLQRLIDDLLVLARGDAGVPLRTELVDLDDIVLEEVRAAGRTTIEIDVARVSGAQVVGNAVELRRVVRNLVDNALRHAHTHVAVELAEEGDRAFLTVSDDGPGIPEDRREEVFERFSRVDESRTGGGNRAGLGLAIAHDIVSRHRGTIVVRGSAAGGARVEVAFPTA